MDLGLSGRAGIVTGASRGIGLAIARGLAAEGARVLMVSRGERELAARAAEIDAEWLALDVSEPDAGDRIVACCAEQMSGPDFLVNNAGIAEMKALEELTDADWQRDWDLHVMASMRLMRAACPRMAGAGWGRVVNVSSSSGKRPSGTLAMSYSVTKAAQLALSRAFADRYAADGVRVNAIAPGMALSEGWTGAGGLAEQLGRTRGTSAAEVLRAQGERLPIGRALEVDEVAQIAVILCSEVASGVAGAAWSVDGGVWASIV
ncbi:SDR family NAD(P)-dependent oxidoreductase [Capillimicrobium parvum]|uniref:3-oxoacyl-[acyl-carrier-protein] reductase FabG n=1 Tax=Capillimicrobium parvum TaxID=2884022 RepID=A0A9E6Y0P0_9ACTN|nr:SDR family oxidoreductase [Capillimicrobium parvum]UGS37508.1 3-oxoacyl-[acyl-carrier-protein] reductase FabG [Capillimicrobium parvum]